jgi:hypothetical protein
MFNKNSTALFLVFTISISVLLSCRSVKDPEFQKISEFQIIKPGFQESVVSLNLEFINTNNYKVNLKEMACSLYIENNYLGYLQMDTLIKIKANDLFILPLIGKLNMNTLMKNSMSFILRDSIKVKAEGKGKIGRAGIFVNYPFLYEGKHSISEFLK